MDDFVRETAVHPPLTNDLEVMASNLFHIFHRRSNLLPAASQRKWSVIKRAAGRGGEGGEFEWGNKFLSLSALVSEKLIAHLCAIMLADGFGRWPHINFECVCPGEV